MAAMCDDGNRMIIPEPDEIIFMGSDPCPDTEPDDIRQYYEQHNDIQGLADAYAAAHNKAWWVEDDQYDYDEGTPEYEKAHIITQNWFKVMEEMEERILALLKADGIMIPETGRIIVLSPFMEKFGYYDGNGWWIKEKSR